MKNKKIFIPVFTLSVALLLTACSGKEAADTTKTQTTQTEAGTEAGTESGTKSGTETTGTSGTKLDDLYQQENQIFADHEEVWNKVFGMMNKSTADPSGNYADYLADTVDSNKDSFSEDELKTLTDDIETIRKIEEQIAELENDTTTSEDTDAENNSEDASPFRDFSGQDYDGNTVDESLFSNNAVTVVNFWFTGCKPCVAELSKLNELNDAIKSMGGEVVGINTETFDANKDAIKEAASILESQGAKYRNLSIDSDSAAGKYASDIMAFPTTILVDRNGNIVGEPMLGGIDNQDNYDTLMKQIQSVIDADSAK
ncbi:redoxin domain-containing protein [Blautia sp. MCC289]|nr:redoxin domain-containing protein [Blautia sp. MCC289]